MTTGDTPGLCRDGFNRRFALRCRRLRAPNRRCSPRWPAGRTRRRRRSRGKDSGIVSTWRRPSCGVCAASVTSRAARRHDFGVGMRDAGARERIGWSLPKQDVVPGRPWHVSGSLLGLDVALAPLVLRRVTTDPVATAPKLTSNERETFAVSVSLMNASALTDTDRDAIASAVQRGRERVAALTPASFEAAAGEIDLDGWRRRSVRWDPASEP